MELRDYLRIARRGWALILACLVLGVALAVTLTVTTKKVYEANVQVFVATSANDDPAELAAGNSFTSLRVQSYTSIATSPDVTSPVVKKLKLAMTQAQLANKISADAPQNKVLVNLHVTDWNPVQAARLANAVAAEFSSVVEQTEQKDANGDPVVKLTVIHPATVPGVPIKPRKEVNIALGFVLGLLLGVGIVVLRDVLDNTVKGPDDFERHGVPVLGYVPFDKHTAKTPVAFRDDPHGGRSEAYRQLRTNLQFVEVDHPPRVIAVTSAMPGEGKSTTAMNLASALAEAGFRVCLLEADLRRPTLAASLGLVGDVGFTTVLIGKTPVDAVLQKAGPNLTVLTSGRVPPNPSELLISAHARTVIAEIAGRFDFTIIDTPPLLPVADGAEIATIADATVIVSRAGKTTHDQVERAVAALAKVGARPVGVILNMITRSRGDYDYGYAYYTSYRPTGSRRGSRKDDGIPPAGLNGFSPDATGGPQQPAPQEPARSKGR